MLSCSTAVQTDKTGAALAEIRREIDDVLSTRPLTDEELAYFKSSEINGFPGEFEQPAKILGELEAIWRYGLRPDWTETFTTNIQAVSAGAANAALAKHLSPERVRWLVVGDAAVIRPELDALGLPIVRLDRDGNPLPEESP